MNSAEREEAATDSREVSSREAATVLGIDLLPSSATEPASLTLLEATLALSGLVLLQRTRRKS